MMMMMAMMVMAVVMMIMTVVSNFSSGFKWKRCMASSTVWEGWKRAVVVLGVMTKYGNR